MCVHLRVICLNEPHSWQHRELANVKVTMTLKGYQGYYVMSFVKNLYAKMEGTTGSMRPIKPQDSNSYLRLL